MPCDKDTFRLFSSLSLFVHIRIDVIETVYLSFFLQFYTNFRPDSRWSSWACLKFIDLMSVARRTFTFSSETETSRKDEEYETVEDGAGQGGIKWPSYRNCHCRFSSDVIIIWMWNSTIDRRWSVKNIILNLLVFRSPTWFTFCRNSHVAPLLSSPLCLLFVADEAYEAISEHLIF